MILARRWVVFTTCDTWAGMPIAGFSSGSVGNNDRREKKLAKLFCFINGAVQQLLNYTLCLCSLTSSSLSVQQFARPVGDLYLTFLLTSPACCLPLFPFSIGASLDAFSICSDRLIACAAHVSQSSTAAGVLTN
jgi:hypothetical protein